MCCRCDLGCEGRKVPEGVHSPVNGGATDVSERCMAGGGVC
jgi:hypothetical protein